MEKKYLIDCLPVNTPPTFERLVDLIEKNFRGYMEQSQAFTTDEIEDAWQRYKTINHLSEDKTPSNPLDLIEWIRVNEYVPWDKVWCKRGEKTIETDQGVLERYKGENK